MSKNIVVLLLVTFGVTMFSCSESNSPTEEQFPGFSVPKNFPTPTYDLTKNPVTKNGFTLGKKLFYDGILSIDGTIACGTCHIPSSAFTQHGHDLSHGVEDRLTLRNTPSVQNMAWKKFFQWDGGVFDLDLFPINPITAHNEMDETIPNVLEKLRNHKDYPGLFEAAFGSNEINSERFLKALSQFQLMCISANSKYDIVSRAEGATFTTDENAGYVLFKAKCESCHKEPFFTDESFRSNGISPIPGTDDKGRARITLNPNDEYKFIVPSLRNVLETAPYMHDGRFRIIENVLDHYSNGIVDSPQLDPIFKNGTTLGTQLSNEEKRVLIAFLATLTDSNFLNSKLLSE